MHPVLLETLNQLKEKFEADPRCTAMFLWGSLGAGTADEYSDVDIAVVIQDDTYLEMKAEFPAICKRIFGEIIGWIPEGETTGLVNFAFLFRADQEVLLYDLIVASQSWLTQRGLLPGERFLFDKTGNFGEAHSKDLPGNPFTSTSLLESIHNYWIYMYLNGKYFLRQDRWKLMYDQHELLTRHLGILKYLYPQVHWTNWWAKDAAQLEEPEQEALQIYIQRMNVETHPARLVEEMNLFSIHARLACKLFEITYPSSLEEGVRRHLSKAFWSLETENSK